MKHFLILGNMRDLQTGLYIVESIESLGHSVDFVDTRDIVATSDNHTGQQLILNKLNELKQTPDIIVVLKGGEMTENTIKSIKNKFKDSILTNWFFDVYFGNKKIWELEDYFPTLKLYDFYFCSLRGVVEKLEEKGLLNVHYLGEACFPPLHGEQYMNNFQKRRYGSDVAFCGSVGFHLQHPNRIPILTKIVREGFDIKFWGMLVGEKKLVPNEIVRIYQNTPVINERHSMVCQSSLINLGIDQMPELDMSFSARIYRVMCAGGLYLSTATKGLENLFKINKEGYPITAEQDMVVFYDSDDLIKKIDFLLENNAIRESIAKNGQEAVKEFIFEKRMREMLNIIKNGKKKRI